MDLFVKEYLREEAARQASREAVLDTLYELEAARFKRVRLLEDLDELEEEICELSTELRRRGVSV